MATRPTSVRRDGAQVQPEPLLDALAASVAILRGDVAVLDADETVRKCAIEQSRDTEPRDAEVRGDLHLGHPAIEEEARDLACAGRSRLRLSASWPTSRVIVRRWYGPPI